MFCVVTKGSPQVHEWFCDFTKVGLHQLNFQHSVNVCKMFLTVETCEDRKRMIVLSKCSRNAACKSLHYLSLREKVKNEYLIVLLTMNLSEESMKMKTFTL